MMILRMLVVIFRLNKLLSEYINLVTFLVNANFLKLMQVSTDKCKTYITVAFITGNYGHN